jgi:hypothetical protein
MNYTQDLKEGIVYFLQDYDAPKVFNGLCFECLKKEQKIPAHAKVKECTETHIINWTDYIYKPERFFPEITPTDKEVELAVIEAFTKENIKPFLIAG